METFDSFALPAGTQLGHYELKQAVAQGGFGVLYRAWDTKLKRQVAVKECFPAEFCHRDPETGKVRLHSEKYRENYEKAINYAYEEAQALTSLHHAQIVPIFDHFFANGSLFYVMPWLDGGTLNGKIATARLIGEPITRDKVGKWLMLLLSALDYLHSQQIIHRDIKPGNIMFDAAENPILIDFGAALNRATKTETTTQGARSETYASPEQISGKGKIGPWTDLYAIAATFYELLRGTAPEPAMQRMMQDGLSPLPSGDTVLEESIMRNLSLAPEARCQSAGEWLQWLQSGLHTHRIAHKRYRIWPWLTGTAGVAVLSIIIGQALSSHSTEKTTATPQPPPASKVTTTQSSLITDEDFYRHVCTQLGLDELVRLTQDNIAQRQELKKRHKQQRNAIVQQMRDVCAANIDIKEKRQQFRELEKQYKELKRAQQKTTQELINQGSSAAAKIQDSVYEPDSKYPWSTQEEYLALRRMQPKLEKQYLPYASDYFTSLIPSNEEIFDELEAEVWKIESELR